MKYLGRKLVTVDEQFELGRTEPYQVVRVWADIYRDSRTGALWAFPKEGEPFLVA